MPTALVLLVVLGCSEEKLRGTIDAGVISCPPGILLDSGQKPPPNPSLDASVNTSDASTRDASTRDASMGPVTSWYRPGLNTSWQWQLVGTLNTSYQVDLYDVDLYDTSQSAIAALQTSGHKVICYFSAGSYENWRTDVNRFRPDDLGQILDGWPDERWLDIRSDNVREIMKTRLDLAKSKGCDGVEPDNVDGYTNNSGFDLSYNDQLSFNTFLAEEAHRRGLSVGLKNDNAQVSDLVDCFDFTVNEECHEYDECDDLIPFIQAGKPVFNVEYSSSLRQAERQSSNICARALTLNFRTLLMPLALDDSFRVSCDDL